MISEIDASLILLTYRGKILLTIEDGSPIRSSQDVWSFIGGSKKKRETFKEAIIRSIEAKISLKLTEIELLSHWAYKEKRKYFFHAQLSDEHVNNLKREDGAIIDFFSLDELEKLTLDRLTKLFIAKHKDFLEHTPNMYGRFRAS